VLTDPVIVVEAGPVRNDNGVVIITVIMSVRKLGHREELENELTRLVTADQIFQFNSAPILRWR
jgi:hypothetical protein